MPCAPRGRAAAYCPILSATHTGTAHGSARLADTRRPPVPSLPRVGHTTRGLARTAAPVQAQWHTLRCHARTRTDGHRRRDSRPLGRPPFLVVSTWIVCCACAFWMFTRRSNGLWQVVAHGRSRHVELVPALAPPRLRVVLGGDQHPRRHGHVHRVARVAAAAFGGAPWRMRPQAARQQASSSDDVNQLLLHLQSHANRNTNTPSCYYKFINRSRKAALS